MHTSGDAMVVIDTLHSPCSSISDALGALSARCPGVTDRVMTEQGELRPHVNVFVNGENSRYTGGLQTPVQDPATITIIAAISGG